MGRAAPRLRMKEGERVLQVYRFKGVGASHFVILSGEKRRVLGNGLSEAGELSRRI